MNIEKSLRLQAKKNKIVRSFARYEETTLPRNLQKHLRDTERCNALILQQWSETAQRTINSAWTCKHSLLCPVCSHRRMMTFAHKLATLAQYTPHHGFLTLTLKGRDIDDQLGPQLEKLKASMKYLTERIRKNLIAGLPHPETSLAYSIEIKRSSRKPHRWHPHIHALISCTIPMDHAAIETALRDAWLRITTDSHIIEFKKLHEGQPLIFAIIEIVSYAVKFSQLDPKDIMDIYDICHRKRFFGSTGHYYRNPIEKTPIPEDLAPIALLNIADPARPRNMDITDLLAEHDHADFLKFNIAT